MYRLVLLLLVVVAAACTATSTTTSTTAPGGDTTPSGEDVSLRHVFDGDSIEVLRRDGSAAEVRLIGINAPEGDECHGDSARDALRALLGDGDLTLVTDDDDADRFGRLLRFVYSDGVNANLALLESGDALALQTGHRLETDFVAAAGAAAESGIGLWSPDACGQPMPATGVRILDYVFDPPGRDDESANDEWVEIINESDSLDMSGWILRDESTQHRFRFPDGFRLGHRQTVKIRSGCGTDTTTDLYWCATDPVWSNGGDTIILQLPEGTLVAWEQFAGEF